MTSTARSGSYLISMMLSANDQVMVASEPYLELFRSMRNAFVRHGAPPEIQSVFDPRSPIQDYYFLPERIRIMDTIQAGDLSISFDPSEWDSFLQSSVRRAELQCAELIPYLSRLRGSTYKEMFDNAFRIIVEARNAKNGRWVGIKDAWTIEFFRPLARAYPEARFIVILRDPRAIVNSMLGVVKIDPLQVGQVLSYARHWRKYVAFCEHYRNDEQFKDRLYVLKHEEFVRDPEKRAREICEFLDVEFEPEMLDTGKYFDFATGSVWKGNSSFEEVTVGISVDRAERWRTALNPRIVEVVDFLCDVDMKLIGYEPLADFESRRPNGDVLEHIVRSHRDYCSWRSDLGDPQLDYGFELFRRALLSVPEGSLDSHLIRRSFLFEEVFRAIRQCVMSTQSV